MTRQTSSSSSKAKAKAITPLQNVDSSLSPIDNAVGYKITSPVNLPQLQAELSAATGTEVHNTALSGPDDPSQAIGPDNWQGLWVCPMGLNASTVAQTVADHQPNPNWGIPQVITDFTAVLARLQENPEMTLTDDDRDALLRGVCLNFAAISNARSGSF